MVVASWFPSRVSWVGSNARLSGQQPGCGQAGGFSWHGSAVPPGTESPGSRGDVAQQGCPFAGLTLYFSFLFPRRSPTTSERR